MKMNQKELAEMIATIYKNLGKKEDEITVEDITDELNKLIDAKTDDTATDTPADEGKDNTDEPVTDDEPAAAESAADEPADAKGKDESEVTPDLIAEVVKALNAMKDTEAKEDTKTVDNKNTQQPTKRKYANIFLTTTADKPNGFKARMESMSAPERKKTAYGMFGRAVKCIHASKGDFERAAFTAESKFNDSEMAKEFKALSATVPSDGGYLVPEIYANEIIELLYPATVIYSLGARRLGMSNGNLNIPKIKTGTRALFTGENRAIPKSAPKFGNLRLSAKKLTALIPMSNDLLRSTNFDNDVIVGQDITKQMALGVDYGALMGTGGEFQPLGIMKNKNVQNIDATALDAAYATSAGVLTAAFPNYLVANVLKNNVYADGLGFVFNTSVEQFFKAMRDNVGGFIFAKEMNENNTLVGYPYKTTNLLETNSGKTSIIFGNWNDLIIGEQGALEIETSREGSWTDESGALVSAFENDQTLIRAIDNVDIGLRHDESFAVATKVAVPV